MRSEANVPRVLTGRRLGFGSRSWNSSGHESLWSVWGLLLYRHYRQNSVGIQGIHAVPAGFVEAQVKSVLLDIGADVVKTGMLPSVEIIQSLCDMLRTYPVNERTSRGSRFSFDKRRRACCASDT